MDPKITSVIVNDMGLFAIYLLAANTDTNFLRLATTLTVYSKRMLFIQCANVRQR